MRGDCPPQVGWSGESQLPCADRHETRSGESSSLFFLLVKMYSDGRCRLASSGRHLVHSGDHIRGPRVMLERRSFLPLTVRASSALPRVKSPILHILAGKIPVHEP